MLAALSPPPVSDAARGSHRRRSVGEYGREIGLAVLDTVRFGARSIAAVFDSAPTQPSPPSPVRGTNTYADSRGRPNVPTDFGAAVQGIGVGRTREREPWSTPPRRAKRTRVAEPPGLIALSQSPYGTSYRSAYKSVLLTRLHSPLSPSPLRPPSTRGVDAMGETAAADKATVAAHSEVHHLANEVSAMAEKISDLEVELLRTNAAAREARQGSGLRPPPFTATPAGLNVDDFRALIATEAIDATPYASVPSQGRGLGGDPLPSRAIPTATTTTTTIASATSAKDAAMERRLREVLSKASLDRAARDEEDLKIAALQAKLDALTTARREGLTLPEEEDDEEEEGVVVTPPFGEKLSAAMERTYEACVSRDQPDDAVLSRHKLSRLVFTAKDARSLRPGEWLTDENVNFYMALLNDRHAPPPPAQNSAAKNGGEGAAENKNNGGVCWFANTFFYNKLYSSVRRYNYDGVKKWTVGG